MLLLFPACKQRGDVDGASALGEPGQDGVVTEALADAEVAAAGIGIARHVLYDEPAPKDAGLAKLPGRRELPGGIETQILKHPDTLFNAPPHRRYPVRIIPRENRNLQFSGLNQYGLSRIGVTPIREIAAVAIQ